MITLSTSPEHFICNNSGRGSKGIYMDIATTPTTTQPQHSSWVGHENDFAHHPPPPTAETQHQPLGAPDEDLLTPT